MCSLILDKFFKGTLYMSESTQIEITNASNLEQHNFSEEIIERIHQYISQTYKNHAILKIVSETEAELYTKKPIEFINENENPIEPESPQFNIKKPLYFISANNGTVEAVINPTYKNNIAADLSFLRLEYMGVKPFPFLLGKILNEGFKFSTAKIEIDGFVIEQVSDKHDIEVCKQVIANINPSSKKDLYLRIEDDGVYVLANKSLVTLKTQFSNAPFEKLVTYNFLEDGTLSNEPFLNKNKDFYKELLVPIFVYSKKKPQILAQIEFMLKALHGDNFMLEISYDEELKADIAIIKTTNAIYRLEINDLASVFKNNKHLNISGKSDPYTILMKEMVKPYLDNLPIKDWTLAEYEEYKQLVHQGFFY